MRSVPLTTSQADVMKPPVGLPVGRGAIPHIRSQIPSLTPSDARVAQLIVADPMGVIDLSTSELARLARTSPSTVVRCCQRMGFEGFRHLRLALAREVREDVLHHEGIADDDSEPVMLAKVFASAARALAEGPSMIDPTAFTRAVAEIRAAGRVLFVGVGTSAPIAQDAAYRFSTIGIISDAPPDVHVQHVAARLLTGADVCVAISHTGATRETVATVRAARDAGATTIAITSFSPSPITRLADVVLIAGGRELSFRHEAMASRLALLSLLDAVYVAVAMRSQPSARTALDAATEVIASHRFATGRTRRVAGRAPGGDRAGR
ncbi:MAG: MurR/RpiR family transcriptional regulator [Chloroflexi bacterium]|nr:MurR/RpiR family transcriptional regulator [Chloroflexota bacterium]